MSGCLDKARPLSIGLQICLFMGFCVLFQGGASKIPFSLPCKLHLWEQKCAKKTKYLATLIIPIPI